MSRSALDHACKYVANDLIQYIETGSSILKLYHYASFCLITHRYHNVPAYDDTRVILNVIDGESHTDYINGNYIDGIICFVWFIFVFKRSLYFFYVRLLLSSRVCCCLEKYIEMYKGRWLNDFL